MNTGRTTVGRRLAARLPRAAHVEVDALRDMVTALPLAEVLPVTLENAAAVARNFARPGFDVVLTYPLGLEDPCSSRLAHPVCTSVTERRAYQDLAPAGLTE